MSSLTLTQKIITCTGLISIGSFCLYSIVTLILFSKSNITAMNEQTSLSISISLCASIITNICNAIGLLCINRLLVQPIINKDFDDNFIFGNLCIAAIAGTIVAISSMISFGCSCTFENQCYHIRSYLFITDLIYSHIILLAVAIIVLALICFLIGFIVIMGFYVPCQIRDICECCPDDSNLRSYQITVPQQIFSVHEKILIWICLLSSVSFFTFSLITLILYYKREVSLSIYAGIFTNTGNIILQLFFTRFLLQLLFSKKYDNQFEKNLSVICSLCLFLVSVISIISFSFYQYELTSYLYITDLIYFHLVLLGILIFILHKCRFGDICPSQEIESDDQYQLMDDQTIITHKNVTDLKKRSENKDTECAICKNIYTEKDKIRLLKCSHYFHENCIDPWLNTKNIKKCPICLS